MQRNQRWVITHNIFDNAVDRSMSVYPNSLNFIVPSLHINSKWSTFQNNLFSRWPVWKCCCHQATLVAQFKRVYGVVTFVKMLSLVYSWFYIWTHEANAGSVVIKQYEHNSWRNRLCLCALKSTWTENIAPSAINIAQRNYFVVAINRITWMREDNNEDRLDLSLSDSGRPL